MTRTLRRIKIAIKNEDDTYFRTVSVDGTAAQSDYVDEFPVFWGTIANSTSAKVYFDDLSITTTDAEGNTPTPPEVELPEPTSKFEFDDNLTDSIENTDGTLVSEKITTGAAATAAQYDTGYDNSGKALKLTGTGGYGVSLGKVITDRKYTVAFRMKANAFTSYTAAIFIDSGDATTQKWVSAPIGWRTVGDDPDANKYLKVWSNNGAFIDLISNFIPETDTWYYIAIAADGGTAKMYVDGKQVGNGPIADVITSDTTTYLGVNYWDTPFNGLIDDVYIYNGTTLSDAQVKKLCTE